MDSKRFTIVIHGGCGAVTQEYMTPQMVIDHKEALKNSVQAGIKILEAGGSSMDAVQAAIIVMEDSPLFNAGRGSVYTNDETHELDAAIMCGKDQSAGSICQLKRTRNPIKLARKVMTHTNHVLLAGEGANKFAEQFPEELVDESYFNTVYRLEQVRAVKNTGQNKTILDHTEVSSISESAMKGDKPNMGTVGAVAVDSLGNLAAGTSTGGMTNKKFGRVGDSSIIGAGTYANNATCAVSCTGHGEYFQRALIGFECHAQMKYRSMSLKDGCDAALEELSKLGGKGGLIAVDKEGNIALPFNTAGMFRGWGRQGEEINIEF